MNIFKKIWGKIFKKGENKMAEEVGAKLRRFIAAGAIGAAVAVGLTGCPSPVGGGGELPIEEVWSGWVSEGDPIVKNGDDVGGDIIVDQNDNAIPTNSGYIYTYIKQVNTSNKGGRDERYLLLKEPELEEELGEEVWSGWVSEGDPIVKNGDDVGGDIIVDQNDNAIPTNSGYIYTYIKQVNTSNKGGRDERYLLLKEPEPITLGVNLSEDRVPGVADINTLSTITGSDIGTGEIVDNEIVDFAADDIIPTLLYKLSGQAAQLEKFFEYSSDHFNDLQDAESEIKNKVTTTTLADYFTSVNAGETKLFELIGENENGTSNFNTLWNGYKAGHYIITRDWRTIGGVSNVDATKFAQYRDLARSLGYTNDVSVGHRAGSITMPNPAQALPAIENALVNAGVAALGMDAGGPNDDTQVEKMFRALVRQFGQDNEELRAFYDDIEEVGLDAAGKTHHASKGAATAMAPIGQQSVKLAALDTTFPLDAVKSAHGKEFDLDAVKSAYGKEFDTYTGAFTPYKKNEDRMA